MGFNPSIFRTAPLFRGASLKYRKAKDAFDRYDRNEDGLIDFDEFVEMVLDDLKKLPSGSNVL